MKESSYGLNIGEGHPLALPMPLGSTAPGLPPNMAEEEREQRLTVPAATWLVLCNIKAQSQSPDHTRKQSDVKSTTVCLKM